MNGTRPPDEFDVGPPPQRESAVEEQALDAAAKPTPPVSRTNAMSSLFMSAWFVPTLRLTVATVLGSLFTLLGPVAPMYCFTAVFVVWVQTQLCLDTSVGTALNAAALLLGAVWVGCISSGALTSLSMLAEPGAARTAALCCLGVAGLVPFAVIRAGPDPASLNSQGVLGTVMFGLSMVLGQFAHSHADLWENYVGGTLQALCAASAASLVATLVVLPTLASEKVPGLVITLIRDAGAAISSGSPLLAPTAAAVSAAAAKAAAAAAAASTAAAAAPAAAAAAAEDIHIVGDKGGKTGTEAMVGQRAAAGSEAAKATVAAGAAAAGVAAATSAATDAAGTAAAGAAAHGAGPGAEAGTEASGAGEAPGTPVTAGTGTLVAEGTPVAPGTPVTVGSNQMETSFSIASLLFEDAPEVHDTYIRLLMAATRPTNMLPIDPLMSEDETEGSPDLIQAWYRPAVAVLRQRLAAANALLPAASVEPAWLTWTCSCMQQHRHPRFRAPDWQRLMAAVGVLVSRVASLECVLEEGQTLYRSNSIISAACHTVFAQSAAVAARLSLQLEAWHRGSQSPGRAKWAGATGSAEWETAKAVLHNAFHREIGEYWQRVQAATKAHPMLVKAARPTTSLMFLGSLAVGMMAAAEELEAAVEQVLSSGGTRDAGAAAGLGEQEGGMTQTRAWVAGALEYLLGWVPPLMPLLLWSAPWHHLLLMKTQLLSLLSRPGMRQLLSQRYVQAGFKFWLACAASLAVILVLNQLFPIVASNMPVFGFIATVAAMRERVESTLEKVAARVVGTILGATASYGIMSSLTLANSPGALAAFLVGACLLLGPWAQGHLRLMVGLALWTFVATILCQFHGCCGATQGLHSIYITRLVSVAGGVIWTSALNRMLLPWSGSAAEVEGMADMVKRSVALMRAAYEVQYEEARHTTGGGAHVCPDPADSNILHEDPLVQHQGSSSGSDAGDAGVSAHAPRPLAACSGFRQVFSWAARELSSLSKGLWTSQTDEEQRAAERRLVQDPNGMAQALGAPLVKVQKQMEREGVPWKSGLLAVPQLARDMLAECGRLMDAMEALQLAAIGRSAEDTEDSTEDEQTTSAPGAAAATALAPPSHSMKPEVLCELGPAPGSAPGLQRHQAVGGKELLLGVRAAGGSLQQPGTLDAAPAAAAAAAASHADDVVFISFIQPLDGLIRSTLEGAEVLAVLVVGHCRWPSDATRAALEQQIQDLMELRTAVWSALVKSRKQRLKAIRSGMNLRDMRSSFLTNLGAEQPVLAKPSEQTLAEAAAELVAVQHSNIAVKYLAVIFAMYKVNNRLMAVARMVLQYGENEVQKPAGAV